MTLDPVHFAGIVRLAERIRPGVDASDHRDFAQTVWQEFLDPLSDDGVSIIEPLGEQRRRRIAIEDAALMTEPFPTQHGLDSGTINPTTFKNGLVIDVAQAAMSAEPSDLDLHRARTVVATVHASDVTVDVDEDEWIMFDDGYSRERILQAPRTDRFEQQVVHVLALYLAESQHALTQAEVVEDLLVLDGPLYPKGLLEWKGRDSRLEDLLVEEKPRDVVENYLRMVEKFTARDVPVVGFVKTPTARAITRTLRRRQGNAPWVNDTAFFRQVLDRGGEGLCFTNWFISRGGVDRTISTAGDALGLERRLEPSAYEVTFFMLYEPREDLLFRVEAPYAFTRDPETRERLTMAILQDVAIQRGPPLPVEKADELARISREEKAELQEALEGAFETERETGYDETRWGLEYLGA